MNKYVTFKYVHVKEKERKERGQRRRVPCTNSAVENKWNPSFNVVSEMSDAYMHTTQSFDKAASSANRVKRISLWCGARKNIPQNFSLSNYCSPFHASQSSSKCATSPQFFGVRLIFQTSCTLPRDRFNGCRFPGVLKFLSNFGVTSHTSHIEVLANKSRLTLLAK